MREYYAHTLERRPKEEWELLRIHLEQVARRCETFAAGFGAGAWGRLAGLWHDLGKYSIEFQKYLESSAQETRASSTQRRVDHSTAGAQHAVARLPVPVGRVFAYCIAGHHGGLPDATDDAGGGGCLDARLKKSIERIDDAPTDLLESGCPSMPPLKWKDSNSDSLFPFRLAVFCRQLFSCLVDADFLATEGFMGSDRAAAREREQPTPNELLGMLDAHLALMEARCKASPVNVRRREVLAACRAKAELPPGLFSLTVPTGGGKTLSSMAFALTHASRHGLRRVIYAIPFTSIIEQNAKVFRKVFASAGEAVVLEHHSNFERTTGASPTGDYEEFYWDWLASENWDAPIVVTTNVQLFESLFANKPSRCRKLHRIAKSVIVLDEVQTLPVELLRPTLAILDELCRNYGCSVVLCSATQPAVGRRDGFPIGLSGVREIIDDPPTLFVALKRVHVERIGTIENADLTERLARHDQALCVVNTRAHAAELFRLLRGTVGDGVFHLSATMCADHRTDVLERIRERLDPVNPRSCRVVSTQLVEAGVDIDFPVVYRAMTGIDSIAQAAGRCNREGRLERGHVFVFETSVDPRGDLRIRRQIGAEVSGLSSDLLGLDAVERYFSLLYWSRAGEWDKHEIMKCFDYNKNGLHAQFRRAATDYRWIRDEQQPILIPYGEKGTRLVDELKSMHERPGRAFSRRAQRFTVGVHKWQLPQLCEATLVAVYHERFFVLEEPGAYDDELGLRIDTTCRDPRGLIG